MAIPNAAQQGYPAGLSHLSYPGGIGMQKRGCCTAIPNAAQQGYLACLSFLSYPEGIEGLPVQIRHDLCCPQMGAHLKFLKHGIESGEDPFGRPSFDDVSEALGQTDRD